VGARVVTVVGPNGRNRTDLAGYLQQAGFDVRAVDRMPRGSPAHRALVWLTDRDGDLVEVAATIDAWLGANGARRAIVVTWRPAAFRVVREAYGDRLVALPAPVFGWQVVDALRARERGGVA